MVFDEVLLLPKPCSTKNAPRRSEDLSPRGTCTTPESLSPAEEKVTACSVMALPVFRVSGSCRLKAQWRRACRPRCDLKRSRPQVLDLEELHLTCGYSLLPFGLPSPSSLQRA